MVVSQHFLIHEVDGGRNGLGAADAWVQGLCLFARSRRRGLVRRPIGVLSRFNLGQKFRGDGKTAVVVHCSRLAFDVLCRKARRRRLTGVGPLGSGVRRRHLALGKGVQLIDQIVVVALGFLLARLELGEYCLDPIQG